MTNHKHEGSYTFEGDLINTCHICEAQVLAAEELRKAANDLQSVACRGHRKFCALMVAKLRARAAALEEKQ